MRIDLLLQKPQLRVLQVLLLFPYILHQHGDLRHHTVEAVGQRLDLVAAAQRKTDGKIPARHLFRRPAHVADRLRDLSRQVGRYEEAPGCEYRNAHGQQHDGRLYAQLNLPARIFHRHRFQVNVIAYVLLDQVGQHVDIGAQQLHVLIVVASCADIFDDVINPLCEGIQHPLDGVNVIADIRIHGAVTKDIQFIPEFPDEHIRIALVPDLLQVIKGNRLRDDVVHRPVELLLEDGVECIHGCDAADAPVILAVQGIDHGNGIKSKQEDREHRSPDKQHNLSPYPCFLFHGPATPHRPDWFCA